MPVPERAPLCKPCKDRGRICLAHRIVDGTPMCDECFKGEPSNGVPAFAAVAIFKKKEEGKAMGSGPRCRLRKRRSC
jgi:hypothetical protein